MATLQVFSAGYCTHPGCIALRGGGWRVCRFPARAWLIGAAGRHWLWDTGYASHFLDHTRHGVFSLYRRVTPVHFDTSEAVRAQLLAAGLPPRELAGVILSHFHGDHTAGLRDFPQVPIWASAAAWHRLQPMDGWAALLRAFVPGLMPEDFGARLHAIESLEQTALPAALQPFERAFVLPDTNREVLLVPLPGHADGHFGAFVATDEGWVLLAADAAWSAHGYQDRRGPARIAHVLMDNTADYYRTLDRLHALDAGGHARILLTHEGAL